MKKEEQIEINIETEAGYTPIKGVDYFTLEEQQAFISEIMSHIVVPENGKDAEPVDYSKIELFIKEEVSKIPKPKDGVDGISPTIDINSIVISVLELIPKQPEIVVDYKSIEKFCEEKIIQIERSRPRLNSGGPTTRLGEMNDIIKEGQAINTVLVWNGANWVYMPYGSGGIQSIVAGTNITVDDTDPANPIVSATGGTPGGSATELQYNDSGVFGGLSGSAIDDTNQRLGLQVATPQTPLHVASVVGTTLNNVVTGSVSLVTETLPTAPTGSITLIAEPIAPTSGGLSFVDQGSGNYQANNSTYTYRVYTMLDAGGIYYRSQFYYDVIGTDPNDGDYYNISVSWDAVTISGETVAYYVEKDINGGGFSIFGVYTTNSLVDSGSGTGGSYTPYPTFYVNIPGTPPTAFTGGSASGQDVGAGVFNEIPTTVLMEVDSVANIGGIDYVSGSPTSGSFDDSGMVTYNPEIAWTDNGGATNAIARVSQDGGASWIYAFVNSTTSPYRFTSTSNDTSAEARWGQTYSASAVEKYFAPYGQGTSPSSNIVYSTAGTTYSGSIPADSVNYIFKHSLSGGSSPYKILAPQSSPTNGISTASTTFYDVGYTSWSDGTTVTPQSYGFTGTAQNRDYRIYSSGSGIFGNTPLTISTTSGSGSKSVSGTFSYPSGITQVKILRQVNGGGYTVSKTINSPTATFTDDSTDTTWSGNTTITPNSIISGAGRFDRVSSATTDEPVLSLAHTGGGLGYIQLGFGIAASSSSAISTYVARLVANTSSGYFDAITARFQVGTSVGGTPLAIMGNSNVFNNTQSSSTHFNIKGVNDANLMNTRSDFDTVAFGQAISTDQATTVQIHPARSSDLALALIGHSGMSDSTTIFRTQTNAGGFTSEVTTGGWYRVAAGALTTPSLSSRSQTRTGLAWLASNTMNVIADGIEQARFTTTGTNVRVGTASSTFAKVGGTISASTTAVGNVGVGEDTLITYTLPANSLSTNLDRIKGRASGTFASNANNKRIRLYFGTTVIFDTTALAFNGGNWVADFEVIRVSNTQQKASVTFCSSNALLPVSAKYTLVAMTLTSSQVIRCTGEATSNNDVVQETSTIEYKPI